MEIFNIGPLELIIVLVIMFVLLGPDEMKRTARRIAIAIRKFVRSPMWAEITGIREEIRELPKRLMEDTGLEEAVQDIKATTTAASEEVNAAVKESVEAARVREVENLRVMTSQKLSPQAGQVIMPPKPSQKDADAGDSANTEENRSAPESTLDPEARTADAAAYTLEVDIEPDVREPTQGQAQDPSIAETANSIMPPAVVVKKPRKKKVTPEAPASADAAAPQQAGEELAASAPQPGLEVEAPKKRRAPRRKTEPDQPTTVPGKNGSTADETPIAKDETNEPNAA